LPGRGEVWDDTESCAAANFAELSPDSLLHAEIAAMEQTIASLIELCAHIAVMVLSRSGGYRWL